MQQISAQQLAAWLADENQPKPLLLDVREAQELAICCLPGVKHIPLHLIPMQCSDLPSDLEIVVICHHGGRSMQAAMFLEHNSFSRVHNLSGGVEAWATNVDATMRRY
jgi:rhodanese-related sulfurtransferase